DGVPPHVRQHRGIQFRDRARPLPQTLAVLPALDAPLEHDLHADADAQHGAAAGEAAIDDLISAVRDQCVPHCCEGADAGDEEPVGLEGLVAVSGQLDIGAGRYESLDGGVDVARLVVEHRDAGRAGHSAPLVEGMPSTRGSSALAWRNARANALNSASAMWCGSRPPSRRTCTVS